MAIDGKAYFEMRLPNNTSGSTDFSNMMGAIIAANKIFEQQKKEPSAKSGSPSSPKEEKIYTDQEIEELLERVGRKRNR